MGYVPRAKLWERLWVFHLELKHAGFSRPCLFVHTTLEKGKR